MAPGAKPWLAQTKQAHVLHAFERVINFLNQEGDVLALVSHALGNGPFSLRLEPGPFPSETEISASLLIFENGFWLDDWLIDAEEAELWQPKPDWASVHGEKENLQWAAQVIAALLQEHAEPDSLARLVLDPLANSPLPARILQIAEQNIPLLYSGIADIKMDLVAKATKSLAGVGPGLTPAGDDLLLGAMHGLWATKPELDARSFSEAIAKVAVERTHALSAAWLNAGARGEAAEPWHDLIKAIAAHDEGALKNATLSILPTGHTSGADALGGFMGILQKAV